MNEARAWELFAAAASATLATIDSSGMPRLVPVTFAVAPGPVVVSAVDHKPKTTRRLARISDLRRDARAVLLADHYEDDWEQLWWVRVAGTASVSTVRPDEGDALVDKYPQYRSRPPDGPWILLRPERIKGWEAG